MMNTPRNPRTVQIVRKSTSLWVVLLILCSLLVQPVQAQPAVPDGPADLMGVIQPPTTASGAVTVSLDAPEIVRVGDNFTAFINTSAVDNLSAFQFQISYDPEVISLSAVVPGQTAAEDDLFYYSLFPETAQGVLRIVGSYADPEGTDLSGCLAEISFQAVGPAGSQTSLDFSSGTSFDNQLFDCASDTVEPVLWESAGVSLYAPVRITTASPLPQADLNIEYSCYLNAEDGFAPYTWSLESGTWPAGLNLDSETGEISGIPSEVITVSDLLIRVTDNVGDSDALDFSLSVAGVQPSVETLAASPVATTSATLNGQLLTLGSSAQVNLFFEYWEAGGETQTVDAVPSTAASEETFFSAGLSGLTPYTTYYYRAGAAGLWSPVYGEEQSFKTAPCPVSLFLTPTDITVTTDSEFSVRVMASADRINLSRVDTYLSFDSSRLEVLDASESESGIQITPGGDFNEIYTNTTDNDRGLISFSAGGLNLSQPPAELVVAEIRFQARSQTATGTTVEFSVDNATLSAVYVAEGNITDNLSSGTYWFTAVPTVVSVSPASGAVDVAAGSPLVLTFNKAMDPQSVLDAFSLSPAVEGEFSWDSEYSELTFTPDVGLDYSTLYTVELGTSALDSLGFALGESFSSTFTTVTVLTELQLDASEFSLAKGRTRQLTVTPVYSDGTNSPLPAVTWSSSHPELVSVDNNGLICALESTDSPVTISAVCAASYGDITGSALVTVTGAALESLSVSPSSVNLAKGRTQQLDVYPTWSDGTHSPVPEVVWSSTEPLLVSVDDTGLVSALAVTSSAVTITAACAGDSGDITGTAEVSVTPAELDSLTLDPLAVSLAKGRTQQFSVTPLYSDGSNSPLPAVTWSSSDSELVSVDDNGLAAALAVTSSAVTIYATCAGDAGTITGTAEVSVTAAVLESLSLDPLVVSLAKGHTQQFSVTPLYSDGSNSPLPAVTWSSSASELVSVDDNGLATALAVTSSAVTITAAYGDINASAMVSVTEAALESLTLDPLEVSLAKGRTQQFSVTPLYSDGTTAPVPAVTWSSSASGLVSVDDNGLATALAVTSSAVTISAACGEVNGTAEVSVTAAVLESLTLDPLEVSLAKGRTQQFSVIPVYSDGTSSPVPEVAWSSSNPGLVSVDDNGLAEALGDSGAPVTITAAYGAVSGTAEVSVGPAELISLALDPPEVSLAKGRTQQFSVTPVWSDGSASIPELNWSSSDAGLVSVDDTGLVTALAQTGSAVTVTAACGEVNATAAVSVIPAELDNLSLDPLEVSLAKGRTQQFTVTPTWSDGSTTPVPEITWSSSDSGLVSVDDNGLAAALAVTAEPVTLTAACGDIQGTAAVSVTPAELESLTLAPLEISLAKGRTQQFSISAVYSDGTALPLPAVTWSSSDPDNVTIDDSGLAAALGVTTATVTLTAACGDIQGTAAVSVTPAVIESFNLAPLEAELMVNETLQYEVVVTYSDGTHEPLPEITWSSSDPDNVTIDDNGLAAALALTSDTVTITARSGDWESTAALNVVNARLQTLTVSPAEVTLAEGHSHLFSVEPTYSDGTHAPLPVITWSSSDPDSVTIDSSGLAVAAALPADNVTITASARGISGSALIRVIESGSLYLSPARLVVSTGDNFTLALMTTGSSGTIDNFSIYLDYAPDRLTLLDAEEAMSGLQIRAAVPASAVLVNQVDNLTGRISFSADLGDQPVPADNYTLAYLDFSADNLTDNTTLVFTDPDTRINCLLSGGTDITGTLTGSLISARPTVQSVPAAGASGVSITSDIVLQFSKAMDPAAVAAAFSLSPSVSGVMSWSPDNQTLTFNPESSLAYSTLYTIRLDNSTLDTEGISLAGAWESTFTTAKKPSTGGGGGGGSSSGGDTTTLLQVNLQTSGFESDTKLNLSSSGILQSDTTLETTDGCLVIDISQGTQLLSSSQTALTSIQAIPLSSPPSPPAGNTIVLAYTFGPEGATFNPALNLTFTPDPAQLPEGVSPAELQVAYYNGTEWEILESVYNPESGTLSVKIDHFSSYALLVENEPAPAVSATPSVPATVAATPAAATPSETASQPAAAPSETAPSTTANTAATAAAVTGETSASPDQSTAASTAVPLVWIILGVVVVIVLLLVILISRRRRLH